MDPTRTLIPLATFGFVVALLGSCLVAARTMHQTSRLVVDGESRFVLRSLRGELRDLPATLQEQDLALLLAPEGIPGLRYLKLESASGTTLEVGAPSLELPEVSEEKGPGGREVRAGASLRRRVKLGPPPRGMRRGRKMRSRRDLSPRTPRRKAQVVDYEIHSSLAQELLSSGKRLLQVGGFSALAFFGFAALLIRLLRERESAAQREAHRERLASLGEMSTVLAHEIRTPLTSLKGSGQLLLEAAPEEGRIRKRADRIVRQVERLETLLDDLLEFARLGELNRAACDPEALVRSAAKELDAEDRIAIEVEEGIETWSLDAERLRQVLVNLLQNALQVSPPESQVEVRLARRGSSLELRVRDAGEGIEDGEEEKIFEPFVTKKANGTGLGLAVARRLVELHGGKLLAQNHPEGGAEFRATFDPGGRKVQ